MNVTAIITFLVFVAITLGITRWAARRARSRSEFYTAGGSLTGLQNGVAFTGEFLSAATFLGITGLYFTTGYDGLIYSIGALMGWPVLLFLLSDRLRRMGRYTLTDVLAFRLKGPALRVFSACATVVVLILYMVAQLVGAGGLVDLLFGIDFVWSVTLIGVLMIIYVIFGGMVATTWVQIVKACFLLTLGLALGLGVLTIFDFDVGRLLSSAVAKHPSGAGIMAPSSLTSPGAVASAALTQAVGLAGLPHLIMRFFTVPSVVEARRSANYATALIGAFYILMIVIGYGTIAVLSDNATYAEGPALLRGGNNMATLYLAHALGGDALLGLCAAAVFATILAVVAGLTLAVAATISHDIFGTVIRRGLQTEAQEIRMARIAAIAFGVASIALSVVFRHENITFLVVTALSIAASSTFPILFLACFWRSLTTVGALIGGTAGLVLAVTGIVLGPTVWVAVLGYAEPVFPYQYPTIASMPIAMALTVVVSIADRKRRASAGLPLTAG